MELSSHPAGPGITIQLGAFATPQGYQGAFENQGIKIGRQAMSILNRIGIQKACSDLDVVVCSVDALGFRRDVAHFSEICAAALAQGLRLCPAEAGPAFRLVHESPLSPRAFVETDLYIGMEAIETPAGMGVFALGADNRHQYLQGEDGLPDTQYLRSDRFLFAQSGCT